MKQTTAFSRPVIFGEVLFDCFPDGSRVLGGAPFNVAWHCQAFGLQPLFISRIGDDAMGHEVRTAMQSWGMDTSGLQLDPRHSTGMVKVSFDDGEPAYDIVENSAWDFIDAQTIPTIERNSLLYHGSLALRNPVSADSLSALKQQCSQNIFIDINLRPPWWQLPMVKDIIRHGRWIKLNIDELTLIAPQHDDIESGIDYLLSNLDIELLVVTQGDAGAIAATRHKRFSITPNNSSKVIDTVGAGDAFSSVLLLGLYQGWPFQQTLAHAQQFASAIVGQRGATTQDSAFYQPFIHDWQLQT